MIKYDNGAERQEEWDVDWLEENQNCIEPEQQWDGEWPEEAEEHQPQDLYGDEEQEGLLCIQCGGSIHGCICHQQAQQEDPQVHAGKFRAQPVDPPKKNRTQIRVHLKKKKALREKFLTPLLMDICAGIIRSSKTNINYNHFVV